MADQDFRNEEEALESLSVEELIQSAKEDLAENPPPEEPFQPTLPAEYADLAPEEELEEEPEGEEDPAGSSEAEELPS